MRAIRPFLTAVAAAATLAVLLGSGVASAHEKRQVGAYTFVVGFINEPAIVDQPNSIDLTITDSNNQPVNGVEKTLKAQIIYGGSTQDMTLAPRFNAPGKYNAYFIPTKTGTWKFHFTGAVNDQKVDELFTSGPGRFNDVATTTDLDFPAKTPDLVNLTAQTSSAQSSADSAKTLAIVGIAVGAAGAVLGLAGLGYGLSMRRRSASERNVATGGSSASLPGSA